MLNYTAQRLELGLMHVLNWWDAGHCLLLGRDTAICCWWADTIFAEGTKCMTVLLLQKTTQVNKV